MKGFLDYIPGKSLFHVLNPLTKLILAFMICVSGFISKSHLFLLSLILFNLAIAAMAGLFQRGVMLLKGLAKLSVFIFLLQVLFIKEGNALLKLPLNLLITDMGISTGFIIVLRLISATMPLALMLSITQMNDLSNVLVTKLGIPYKYAFTLTTAMRFIPIFANEMSGIMEAQTSRGVQMDTGNPFKKIKLIFPLCVPLLITSVRKIEGSAISAEIRGFYLRTKNSCYKEYAIKRADIAVLLFSVILAVSAVFIKRP